MGPDPVCDLSKQPININSLDQHHLGWRTYY